MKSNNKFDRKSYFIGFVKKFARHKLAVAGLIIVASILVLCYLAPLFTHFLPNELNLAQRALKPGQKGHMLGTDKIGRDVWARLLYGGRVSIAIGILSALGAAVFGILLGSLSGYIGGILDTVLLRISEIFNIIPSIMLVIIIMALIGPGVVNLCLVFVFTEWMPIYRLVRGRFFSLREEAFVDALRAMSVPKRSIMFKHMLPLALGPVLVNFTIATASFILGETGLSFLGLGVPSGTATWGNILNAARDLEVLTKMPWLWISPGVAICLFVLGVNFIGDGLRDSMDPRQ